MPAFKRRCQTSGPECQHSRADVRHRFSNASIRGSKHDIDWRMPAFKNQARTSIFECGEPGICADGAICPMPAFKNRCWTSVGECWHSKIDVGHRLANAGIQNVVSDTRFRMPAFKSHVGHRVPNAGIQKWCFAGNRRPWLKAALILLTRCNRLNPCIDGRHAHVVHHA
jgi:hypothetical protein